jgi:hypothetical protein
MLREEGLQSRLHPAPASDVAESNGDESLKSVFAVMDLILGGS